MPDHAPGEPATGPAPALVEFAQQLLTSHPERSGARVRARRRAARALLDDADAAGALRPGLDRRRIAGVVLQATMFNVFAAAISASPPGAGDEVLWDLLVHGIERASMAEHPMTDVGQISRGSTMTATIYAGERPKPPSHPVVLKADRMVDVVERVVVEPGVVVVEGDRILDVGPERSPTTPR